MATRMEPWWSKLLFVLLGSTLAIGTSFVTVWTQQNFDKQRRAETLKVAFRGEINALRAALGVDARAAMEAWRHNRLIKDHKLTYPRRIYEAHVANIGDLRESVLVGNISSLYATLERAQDVGRRIEANTYAGNGPRDFALLLVAAFNQALIPPCVRVVVASPDELRRGRETEGRETRASRGV